MEGGGESGELRITEAEAKAARSGFFDVEHHVNLIVAACDRYGFRRDRTAFEEPQALQANLGAVNRGLRKPRSFELAHFAAHHFIGGAGVALEADLADGHARTGHHLQLDGDSALFAVDLRHRIDLGERIADVAQRSDDRVGRQFQEGARESLPGFDQYVLLDLFLRQHRIADDLDAGERVGLAFGHVGSDEHVLLVGTDGHLGAVDAEVDVAAVQIELVELFEVAGELFARVLIVAAVPAQPVALVRFPAFAQILFLEFLVADEVDVADARGLAFLDVDGHVDAVAVEAGDGGIDLDVVFAAVVVSAVEFEGHAVQRKTVVGLTLGDADFLEVLHQVFGLDVLVAREREGVDRRTFGDRDHQDAAGGIRAFAVDADVFKKSGLVQRAHRFADLARIDGVATLDRQVGEDGAGADALQAVDADVGHREA